MVCIMSMAISSNHIDTNDPRNAPLILGIRAIANIIGAGNTTVIKAPEQSPPCFWALGRVFAKAGLPPGVLNIISCAVQDAYRVKSAIFSHPAVREVKSTGSISIGREISTLCGQNLKPCLVELGGKNSAIVLPDADLNLAAQECIRGSFLNVSHHPCYSLLYVETGY